MAQLCSGRAACAAMSWRSPLAARSARLAGRAFLPPPRPRRLAATATATVSRPQESRPQPIPQQLQAQPAASNQAARDPSISHTTETLASLLERASQAAARGAAEQEQEQDPRQFPPRPSEPEDEEDDEWRGPPIRYGTMVSSRAELQAAVLSHWERTADRKVPGTDKEEALLLEGLADIGAVTRAGREHDDWKLVNQDMHIVLPLPSVHAVAAAAQEVGPEAAGSVASGSALSDPAGVLLGCFDGHGLMGTAASRYTRQLIASGVLQNQWRRLERQPDSSSGIDGSSSGSGGSSSGSSGGGTSQALLDAAFDWAGSSLASSGLDLQESGSTAVVCLVEPGRVTAAWAGDSRAVLGLHVERPGGAACLVHPLTEDHRPQRPLERARIEAAGGQVLQVGRDRAGNPIGPFRLCGSNAYQSPRPMVSRAFGDTNAIAWGLTYRPDIQTVELPPPCTASSSCGGSSDNGNNGSYDGAPRHVLILGTDGLWDTTTPVDAVLLARSCDTPLEAARALADAATRRWAVETSGVRCDDITVIVAFLPA